MIKFIIKFDVLLNFSTHLDYYFFIQLSQTIHFLYLTEHIGDLGGLYCFYLKIFISLYIIFPNFKGFGESLSNFLW
jgi:hypothetical protein